MKQIGKAKAPKPPQVRKSRLNPETARQRRELYDQGLNDYEIAERLGVSQPAIAMWRKRQGLPKNNRVRTQYDFSDRMELYNKGMSDGQIAKALGTTQGAILQWRKREGLPANFEQASGRRINRDRTRP